VYHIQVKRWGWQAREVSRNWQTRKNRKKYNSAERAGSSRGWQMMDWRLSGAGPSTARRRIFKGACTTMAMNLAKPPRGPRQGQGLVRPSWRGSFPLFPRLHHLASMRGTYVRATRLQGRPHGAQGRARTYAMAAGGGGDWSGRGTSAARAGGGGGPRNALVN